MISPSRILAFLLMPLFFLAEESQLALLESAYRKSQHCDYIAEVTHLHFPEFPEVTRGIFFRKTDKDGTVLLRTDLYDRDEPLFSFVKNATNEFAISHKHGKTVLGGCFTRLWYFEEMFQRPYWNEFNFAEFSQETTEAYPSRRKRMKVISKISEDSFDVKDLSYYDVFGFFYVKDVLQEQHPYMREYEIDKEEGIILGLRKYNCFSEKIFDRSFETVDFHPDWSKHPKLFTTPRTFDYYARSTAQFLALLSAPRQPVFHRHRHSPPFLEKYGFYLLGAFGLCCIAIAKFSSKKGKSA